jgi:hypothetical protein
MDRAGDKRSPLSRDEVVEVFQSVNQGQTQEETRQRLRDRQRTTVIRAYKVVEEFERRGLITLDDVLADTIARNARYGASRHYVQNLFLPWRAWKAGELASIGQTAPALIADRDRILQAIPDEWPLGYLSTDPKKILRGANAKRWDTSRPQQRGDDFVLDLGKELPIKHIHFTQGLVHQWDLPKSWLMVLQDEKVICAELEGIETIELDRDEPIMVRYISVSIVEPRLPTDHPPSHSWAVDNIELR